MWRSLHIVLNVAASTDTLCNGVYKACIGQDFGKLQTDVWTVFDVVFMAVTVMGILLMAVSFKVKRPGVLIGLECVLVLMLTSVCIIMPLVFGAGLGKIMITWAPYSFVGGLIMLVIDVFVMAIKLCNFVDRGGKTKMDHKPRPHGPMEEE